MSINENRQIEWLDDLRLILKDFLKVIKVVTMYPADNPLPQKMRQSFAERLVDLVTDFDGINLRITKDKIMVADDAVFVDRSRDESLAGLFFETGIIRLSFKVGLEVDEVGTLLDAIKTYLNTNRKTSDLAAILWEFEIGHFRFETVEDAALKQYEGDLLFLEKKDDDSESLWREQLYGGEIENYSAIFTTGQDDFPGTDENVFSLGSILGTGDETADAALQVDEVEKAMGIGEFRADTSLILNDEHKLSEEEAKRISDLLAEDADFADYESTSELLKEILLQETEMTAFYESVTICDKILSELIAAGKLTFAADLLRHFGVLEERLQKEKPLWAERLKEARVIAGSRERLAGLCRSLNNNEQIGAHELRRYLDNFDWEALIGITDMLGELDQVVHRQAVKDYLTERGRDRIPIVAKGIYDKRPDVVAVSVAILAGIGSEAALKHLERVVNHSEVQVRHTLAEELTECPNEACIDLLRRLVNDSDAQVRRQAVAALVSRRGETAFQALDEVVQDTAFLHLDPTDQRHLLTAYSMLGSDMAVTTLLRLGLKYNPLKNRRQSLLREAAFEALANNRGEKAERTLLRLSSSWRSNIKAHARAALQKRREIVYGGSNE